MKRNQNIFLPPQELSESNDYATLTRRYAYAVAKAQSEGKKPRDVSEVGHLRRALNDKLWEMGR